MDSPRRAGVDVVLRALLALLGLLALSGGWLLAQNTVTVNPRIASGRGILPLLIPAGTGGATAQPCGTLHVDTTQAGTPASTDETDLWTYTLPANTLTANGRGVRLSVWGSTAANTNSKTWRVYFGSAVVHALTSASAAGTGVYSEPIVIRTGASSQVARGTGVINSGNSLTTLMSAPSLTSADAHVLKVTGQSAVGTANDLVFRGAVVECL